MAGLIRFALKGYYVSSTMIGLTGGIFTVVALSVQHRMLNLDDVAGLLAAPPNAKVVNDGFRLAAAHQMTNCVAGIGLMSLGYWKAISVAIISNGLTFLLEDSLPGSNALSSSKWYARRPIIDLLVGGALFCLT